MGYPILLIIYTISDSLFLQCCTIVMFYCSFNASLWEALNHRQLPLMANLHISTPVAIWNIKGLKIENDIIKCNDYKNKYCIIWICAHTEMKADKSVIRRVNINSKECWLVLRCCVIDQCACEALSGTGKCNANHKSGHQSWKLSLISRNRHWLCVPGNLCDWNGTFRNEETYCMKHKGSEC